VHVTLFWNISFAKPGYILLFYETKPRDASKEYRMGFGKISGGIRERKKRVEFRAGEEAEPITIIFP